MSSEVGSGHISIFPVMTGFRGAVSKGAKDAGAAGAKSFDGGFKGAGRATGRALGRDLKSAMATASKDLAVAEIGKLNAAVASASAALSKVRLAQQDEAGKVRVAEVRLQEAIAKSGEGSAIAVAAEERLETARRRQQTVTDAVTAATTRLRDAQDAARRATDLMSASSGRASGGLRAVAANLRDGWKDANSARSSFTGLAGSVGGLLRAVSDVSGLTYLGRLAKLTAGQISTAFTSLATMIGGRLARAWQSSSSWLAGVGASVGRALAPAGRVFANVGRAIATPFQRLGSGVATWLSPVTMQVSALFSKISAVAGPAAGRLVSSFRTGLSGIGSATAGALKSVASAAGRAGQAAGQALSAGLKSAATIGVGAAAATIGIALGSGFSRLNAIDTARAKLVGLGNDGKTVAQIMNDATASVKGTSFGLGEAATVAAAAVAAGIKPGDALQGHLKSIANNASAAGISMQDMGSIFNRAATQANGVQNDVISQLADKGIPIYQALADQMGVTAGEVFKLASEGKVDFATFSAAATAAAGTVADEIGKTVPGAFKNLKASLGRSGANIFGGINKETGEMFGLFARLAPFIQSVTRAMAPLEERSAGIGAALDKVLGPALDRATEFFNRLGDGAGIAGTWLEKIAGIVGPLGGVFAALGAGGLASVLARFGPLAALLPGLGGALGLLASPLGIVAAAFAGFALTGGDASSLVSGLTSIVGSVVSALPGLVAQIATFVPQMVASILEQVPALLRTGVAIIGILIQGLVVAIPMLVTGALLLVQGLIAAIVANLPQIIAGAIAIVMALIQGIVAAIPMLITAALQLVTGLLGAIVGALPIIIQGGLQLLLALVMGIVSALPVLLTAVLGLVTSLLGTLIENLPMIIEGGIQLLLALVDGLIKALPQLITAAINLVLQLVTGLLKMLPRLIEAGITLVVSLIKGLVTAIPKIIAMLPQIIAAIWNGLLDVNWLEVGVQIVEGIINGLGSMVGSLVSAIVDLAGSAFQGFKDFFGIASPAKRMIGPGRDVVRGAALGVDREQATLDASMRELAQQGAAAFESQVSSVSGTVSLAVAGARGAGTAGSSSSQAAPVGDIYVQNPWTGEYLLAKVDGRITKYDRDQTREQGMGWRD